MGVGLVSYIVLECVLKILACYHYRESAGLVRVLPIAA